MSKQPLFAAKGAMRLINCCDVELSMTDTTKGYVRLMRCLEELPVIIRRTMDIQDSVLLWKYFFGTA